MKYNINEFAVLINKDIKILESMENQGYFKAAEVENGTKLYLDTQIPIFDLAYENFCLAGLDKQSFSSELQTKTKSMETEDLMEYETERFDDYHVSSSTPETEENSDFQNREEYYEDLFEQQQQEINELTKQQEKKEQKEADRKQQRKKEEKRREENRRREESKKQDSIQKEENLKKEDVDRHEQVIRETDIPKKSTVEHEENQIIEKITESETKHIIEEKEAEKNNLSNMYKDLIEKERQTYESLKLEKEEHKLQNETITINNSSATREKSHSASSSTSSSSSSFSTINNDTNYEKTIEKKESAYKNTESNYSGGATVAQGHLLKGIDYSGNSEDILSKRTEESSKKEKPNYSDLIEKAEKERNTGTYATMYATGNNIPSTDNSTNSQPTRRVSALNNSAVAKLESTQTDTKKNYGTYTSNTSTSTKSTSSPSPEPTRQKLNSTANLRHDSITDSMSKANGTKIDAVQTTRGGGNNIIFDVNLNNIIVKKGEVRKKTGDATYDLYGFNDIDQSRAKAQAKIATGSVMALASKRGITATYNDLLSKASHINSSQLNQVSMVLKNHKIAGNSYSVMLNSRHNAADLLNKINLYAKQRGLNNISKLTKGQFNSLLRKNKGKLSVDDEFILHFYRDHLLEISKVNEMLSKNSMALKNANSLLFRKVYGQLDQYNIIMMTKRNMEAGLAVARFAAKSSIRALKALQNAPLQFRLNHVWKQRQKQAKIIRRAQKNLNPANVRKIGKAQSKLNNLKRQNRVLDKKLNQRTLKTQNKLQRKINKRDGFRNLLQNNKFALKWKNFKLKFSQSRIGRFGNGVGKIINAPFKAFNSASAFVNKIKIMLLKLLGGVVLAFLLIAIIFDVMTIAVTTVTGFFSRDDGEKAETIEESVAYDIIETCNTLNADWVNWLYDLKNNLVPPEDSYETEQITVHAGTHDNPTATTTIPAAVLDSYDDIEVHFVDSLTTRNPISVINNTKQIICMASVYFENDLTSDDANAHIIDYVTQLWKDSHLPNQDIDVASNYGLYYETSDVYYCDGCETYYCDGSCVATQDAVTEAWHNGTCPGELYCPGHVDVHVYAAVLGFGTDGGNDGSTMFDVDSYASENNRNGDFTWDDDNIEWADVLYTQDWEDLYGIDFDSLCVWDTTYVTSGNGSRLTDDELNELVGYSGDNAAVAYALSRIGEVTYIFGAGHGSDYKTSNFLDCSSFVCQVLANTGHDIGVMSTAGLATAGIGVSQLDIQPGDVLVRRNGSSGHTGIYIGQDENGNYLVVHNSGTGINVIVSSYPNLSSWNYIRRIS